MVDTNTALASLIGSRICHDLISPIGAINNGLELLGMSGDPSGPEIGLIGESVGNASARIRFFRVAFGAASEQLVGPAEVNSILRDLYASSRLEIAWAVADSVQRADVRLAFLALMCAESAMPYGGRVEITTSGGGWQLKGTADRINIDADLWGLLSDTHMTKRDLPPSQVQFALLPLVGSDAGRKITLLSDETSLQINY